MEEQKTGCRFKSAIYDEEIQMWKLSLFDEDGEKIGGDILTKSNEDTTKFLQSKFNT